MEPTSLQDAFLKVAQNEHASIVLRATCMIEYDLERCLLCSMQNISSNLYEKLFRGYGPISSLSSKIDISLALNIIQKETAEELNKFRKIRNEIAHSRHRISLDTPPLLPLFNSLKKPDGVSGSYADIFIECIKAADDVLERYLIRNGVTDDLSERNRS